MKLIDKDAVLAIIEKFMYGANIEADIASTGECFDEKVADAKYQLCKCIKGKIDTLEVKEVDLEKIINDYFKDWKFDEELDIMVKPNNYSATFDDIKEIAKYFFELGMRFSAIGSDYIEGVRGYYETTTK